MEGQTKPDWFQKAVVGWCTLVAVATVVLLTIVQVYYTAPEFFVFALVQSLVIGIVLLTLYFSLARNVLRGSDRARRVNRVALICWLIVCAMLVLTLIRPDPSADELAPLRAIAFFSVLGVMLLVHWLIHRRLAAGT